MFRFTIRDLLWLTALVAIGTAWLMDRDKIRRGRVEMAKREAELTSRAKMWENEANRAEQRYSAISERLSNLEWALRMRGTKLNELIDANNRPKFLPPPRNIAEPNP